VKEYEMGRDLEPPILKRFVMIYCSPKVTLLNYPNFCFKSHFFASTKSVGCSCVLMVGGLKKKLLWKRRRWCTIY